MFEKLCIQIVDKLIEIGSQEDSFKKIVVTDVFSVDKPLLHRKGEIGKYEVTDKIKNIKYVIWGIRYKNGFSLSELEKIQLNEDRLISFTGDQKFSQECENVLIEFLKTLKELQEQN